MQNAKNPVTYILILISLIISLSVVFAYSRISTSTLKEAFNAENTRIIEKCKADTIEHSKKYPMDSIYVQENADWHFYKLCLDKNLKDDEIAFPKSTS